MKNCRFTVFVFVQIIVVICMVMAAQAQTYIEITTPMTPPDWAFMEQALLEENARFLKVAADKYVHPITGYLECVERWGGGDGPDDAMERYNGWSLLYALGAPKRTLDLFNFVWNGHIKQYSEVGMFYK